jgi:hypothetical protein
MLSVDIEARTGVCAACGEVSVKVKNSPSGQRYLCSQSQKRWGRRIYSSVPEREKMLAKQGGRCPICHEEIFADREPIACFDHDHQTNENRELLCRQCNCGLGNFRDSPKLLLEAVKYLEKWKSPT